MSKRSIRKLRHRNDIETELSFKERSVVGQKKDDGVDPEIHFGGSWKDENAPKPIEPQEERTKKVSIRVAGKIHEVEVIEKEE